MKYLGVIVTKDVKDLCTEKCKILPGDIKEVLNKWKNTSFMG